MASKKKRDANEEGSKTSRRRKNKTKTRHVIEQAKNL